jgi:magnesium transporter
MTMSAIDLALAFLESRPGAAAELLEQQPCEQVAAFLREVPPGHAAAVLSRMLPQHAARLCKVLGPHAAARICAGIEHRGVATVLRYLDAQTRGRLLALLPEKNRIACKYFLSYPETAVGAWMVTDICSLPVDCALEDARARITAQEGALLSMVTVVDRQRKLRGVVDLVGLLRARPGTSLEALLEAPIEPLFARATLKSAKGRPAWRQRDAIPVINGRHQLVGILRHLDYRNGMAQLTRTISRSPAGDPIADFGRAYSKALLAVFETAFDAINQKSL